MDLDALKTQIDQRQNSGDFKGAYELLAQSLAAKDLSPAERRAIEFEKERLQRIELDYSLTRDSLLLQLHRRIRNFRDEELDQWEKQGRFDLKTINGEKKYLGASVSNLFFRHLDIRARRLNPPGVSWFREVMSLMDEAQSEGLRSQDRFVTPQRYQLKMDIVVSPNAAPAGSTIACWMPYPVAIPSQSQIQLDSTNPLRKFVSPPDGPRRSLYLEQTAVADQSATFTATFDMTVSAIVNHLDPAAIVPYSKDSPDHAYFTREQAPHIVFTPEIRELSEKILDGEKNPLRQARLFYEWVGENIAYSYAREYSTQRNISQECLLNGYGDCGQEALLFMTLCRLNGIPVRWQTGWMIYDNLTNLHDWTFIYLEPYGWIPVDPYMAVMANHEMDGFSREDRRTVIDFYFGNLDNHRWTINLDHSVSLTPPKLDFASDTVDFQRGELEADGKNLYFDKWDYSLKVEKK
ncbi:MAG: transglutaminase-like domain-containing protein [bacterium]